MQNSLIKTLTALLLFLGWAVTSPAQFTFNHVGGGATGSLTPNAEPGSYTVIGGGNDIWDTTDEFDYANLTQAGDFDVRVRVDSLEPTARWSKAGIMAREDLTTGSRMAFSRVTPGDVPTGSGGNGANDTRFAYRKGAGGVDGQHEDCVSCTGPNYPNGWVRLQRTGAHMLSYSSLDGCTWVLMGDQDTATWPGGALAASLRLGLAVGRHSGPTTTARAEFRQYADVLNSAPAITQGPSNVTAFANSSASFSVQLAGGCDVFTVTWKKGAVILGSGYTYTTPLLVAADAGVITALVSNTVNGLTASKTATLTVVVDTQPPSLVGAAGGPGTPGLDDTHFGLRYTEPVNAADAVNLANYSVSGGLTLSSAVLLGDNVTVVFTSSSLNTPTCKEITVNNVRDLAGNPIVPNSKVGIAYGQGRVRYHLFNNAGAGISGGAVSDLTGHPTFPNRPDVITYVTSFQNPNGGGGEGDNYGGQILALLSPSVSGNYRFFISADDNAALYLSSDMNPANKVQIAREPQWAGFREYTGNAGGRRGGCSGSPVLCENVSVPITLQGGCHYYVEALYKEGGGGDHVAVGWQTPGGAIPANGSASISGQFLSPFEQPPTVGAGLPADQTVEQNRVVTWSAGIAGSPVLSIQWFRDGVAIPGATGFTYTLPGLTSLADDGATFSVTVQNSLGTAVSRVATLHVNEDHTPPTVVGVVCRLGLDGFTLTYSELMNPDTAGDQFSYLINDGVNPPFYPTAVETNADARTIQLVFAQTAGTLYTIIIDSASDLAGNAIAHTEIPVRSCLQSCAPGLTMETYPGGGGTAVANLLANPAYPNNPDSVRILNSFDTRAELGTDNFRDNYGARVRGVFVPPASGNYVFYLHSDDSSRLFLNPTGPTAAGKVQIAEETGCCRDWPTIASAAIPLVGGKAYYIEGLYQEGGGGDYIRVAARIQGSADPLVAIPLSQLGQTFRPDSNVPAPVFTTQPQSQTITQNDAVSFSVAVSSDYGFTRQWQMNSGGGWMDIAGATGPTYGYGPVPLSDNGKCFRVKICTIGPTAYSDPACLTVTPDTTPPVLTEVLCGPALDRFTLVFSEFLDKDSAEDNFGYSVNGMVPAPGQVILNPDGKTVTLLFGPQTESTSYTLTVADVKDLAGNVMAPVNRQILSCVAGCNAGLTFETYPTGGGTAVSQLTSHPSFPNSPDSVRRINTFDTRAELGTDNFRDNYGARLRGVFFPPVSGNYNFYLHSDDASELWLNPNGPSAAGKVKIAEELGCCRDWPTIQSAPVYLLAGGSYYIEGLYKEGGGGDYMRVAARLVGSADALAAIPLSQLGASAPAGVLGTLSFNCQPVSTKVCISLTGGAAQPLYANDLNSDNGGFTVTNPDGAFNAPWTYNAGAGSWEVVQDGAEVGHAMTSDLTLPAKVITSPGQARLSFQHRWSMEQDAGNTGWDGGQVQISVNGAPFTAVPGASFTSGGYNGTVRVGSGSAIQGQPGFVVDSVNHQGPGYVSSAALLGTFALGDSVVVRFRYAADSNTRGNFIPSWEITSLALTQGEGQPPASFTVCPTGNQGQPFSIQWEKSVGGGAFTPIPGATSAGLTFSPRLVDNGSCYRAQVCMVGSKATSDIACLTVVQPNTPPTFVCPPNQAVDEDSGAQTVAGLLGPVTPDSIAAPVAGSFDADFTSPGPVQGPSPYTANFNNGQLPPNTIASGTQPPFVEAGGSLRMSELGVTGQQNFWAIPSLQVIHVDEFHASWKSRLAGAGQADGYSFNVGQGLGAFNFGVAEEGTTTGLSVTVDTFDNGDIQPGGEVGCGIKWNGVSLGFTPAGTGTVHGPPELMKDVFVNAAVDVDVLGNVTFTYDNFVVTGMIPGYTGLDIDQYLFAARTGGAAERCYIDDVSISAPPFQPAPVLPPAGATFYGTAYQAGGVLHLTDAANGQAGSIIVNDLLGGAKLGSFTMTFDALVGEGTAPPADGFAVSIANDLPNGTFGEEGAGSGLTVSFDSFDNGGGEAPALDVFYNGTVVAHTLVPSIETGGQFVPVSIRLDSDGTLDLIVAGVPVYTDLQTGYIPITAARFGLGGRTGGLNEKNWIDNLHIAAQAVDLGDAEVGQIVTFHVTNSCPGLFSQQPAVSSDGTLTYTPAPNACGTCTISVYATDNGGTDGQCGGNDRSATCTFVIDVRPVNDCPVAGSQAVSVNEGGMVAIALVYSDVDALNGCGNSSLTAIIVVPPGHGTLSGSFPNLTYRPTNGYPGPCGHASGPDGFAYRVSDGLCSVTGVVSITVVDVNKCPTPVPVITPKCILPAMEGELQVYISCNNTNSCLVLDGMLSSDPDCDTLTYSWTLDGIPISTAMLFTNCLPVGHHEIRLIVDDGRCTEGTGIFVDVITACEAIEALMTDIDANNSMTTSTTAQHGSVSKAEKESRKFRRPLLSSLKSACKAFDRNKFKEGIKKLREFQNKLREVRKKGYTAEADRWWAAAQVIIDSIECCQEVLEHKTHTRSNDNHDDTDNDDSTKPWSSSYVPKQNPKTNKDWRSHEHDSHD